MRILILVIFFVASLLVFFRAQARPEYALRTSVVSCTTCHMSPTGGEIRNQYGKNFGTHGYKLSMISEKAPWFQLDYRAEAFQQKTSAATAKGAFAMTTVPAVALPVQFEKDKPPEFYFITSYNMGAGGPGLNSAYLRYDLSAPTDHKWFEHTTVGRFLPPRGLQTDEHRTFTKVAAFSSMRNYETGAMLSGSPSYYVHYDVAATAGNNQSLNTPNSPVSPWGLYAHVRTIPFLGPVMLGASYSRNSMGISSVKIRPETYNAYGLLSFDKMTYGKIPLDLISEFEITKGWNGSFNNEISKYFIGSSQTAWATALKESRAQALVLQANYWINQRWMLLYKFEQFVPDVNFKEDRFNRFGYGVKWFFNGQSSVQARFEKAYCKRPGVTEAGDVMALGNSAYVLLHFWL